MKTTRTQRIENALWGLFVGDALSMPAHWYYDRSHIAEDFGGGVTGYADAPHPHPESFMVGSDYRPDLEKAAFRGRPYDILHQHARFYDTTYSRLEIASTVFGPEHGHTIPEKEERFHYHHGLKAGENTLGAQLVRVLIRSVLEGGEYDQGRFLEWFVAHMTTSGKNRDPYTEIYLRRWFENYASGLPPERCAWEQAESWSIGSMGGMVRPMVAALLSPGSYQGLGAAMEHMELTHRSRNAASALGVAIPLLFDLLDGKEYTETLDRYAARVHPPEITGDALYKLYSGHKGPGNIPKKEMWELHTRLSPDPMDLPTLAEKGEEAVVNAAFATACYTEHGLPLLLWLARKHPETEAALLANANAGGDNVHRGMLLGMLSGAALGVPEHLKRGLKAYDALAEEIGAFAPIAQGEEQ